MRILILTHYFPPEIGAPQARLSELARTWADDGDDVTVLTGLPNHPTGIVPPEYRGVRRRVERTDGYRVIRTWLYATPNEGIAKKTLGHLSFMVTSVVLGAPRTGPVDVVVVSSPTFFAILSAWFIARARRARFVVEIRDLWPAIFVELGVLTNPIIIKVLETIELAAYRAADEVVVVSDGFRENLISRGVPGRKITTIRNGVDLDRFAPQPADEAEVARARARLGAAADETLVLYIGAHGISHGLGSIADAADRLRDEPVHFAFVGEGSAKPALEARVQALGLDHVTMLPGVPRDEVAPMLHAADICLVPLRDVPLFTTFIPSKIFEYFGTGKAVIGAVRGEPAEILREGGAVVVEPEDADAIAEAVRSLAADPTRRAEMGRRGYAYVREHFDRRQLARTYRRILASAGTDRDRDRDEGSDHGGDADGTAPVARRANPTAALVSYVWRHPENTRGGRSTQLRGVARLAGWQVWQRATGRPLTVTLADGIRLRVYPHSPQASAVIYCRMPEYQDMHFVQDYLGAGDRFVDVGANVGVFSLTAASVPGTVIDAFEPSSTAFPKLIENIALNHLEDRFHVHRAAVGRAAGTVRLTMGLDAMNRILGDEAEAIDSEEVPLVSLDEALAEGNDVALVKIDVEGFEEDVLRGASYVLKQHHPALIIEANDRSAIAAVLEPFGYRQYAYDPIRRMLREVGWHEEIGTNILAVADLEAARRRLIA